MKYKRLKLTVTVKCSYFSSHLFSHSIYLLYQTIIRRTVNSRTAKVFIGKWLGTQELMANLIDQALKTGKKAKVGQETLLTMLNTNSLARTLPLPL